MEMIKSDNGQSVCRGCRETFSLLQNLPIVKTAYAPRRMLSFPARDNCCGLNCSVPIPKKETDVVYR
eukprot:7102489-Karenia_brevis.AAC.1